MGQQVNMLVAYHSAIMLTIDTSSTRPPFVQLREQIIAGIESGELRPGERLPSVRALAAELGIAPNTVARSYRELESDGFLQTRGRNGTIVAPELTAPETHRRALELTREWASAMAVIGVDAAELKEYARHLST